MKKFIYAAMICSVLAGLASCNKPEFKADDNGEVPVPSETRTGTMYVEVGVPTKALVSNVHDETVHSLQVFVFNAATGKREIDKYVEGNSMQITSLVGQKHVWAVVNHAKMDNVPTETEFKALTTRLEDNYVYNDIFLIMTGEKDVEVKEDGVSVVIDVTRLESRIELKKLTVDFSDNYLNGCTFQIKEMYLKNVAGDAKYADDSYAPTVWYNKLTDEGNAAVNPLISDHSLAINLPTNGSAADQNTMASINRVWYTYPNPTVGDDAAYNSWVTNLDIRHTRLIIHAEVSGTPVGGSVQSFYVFTLPVLKKNTSYVINDIKVTMLGKETDDDDSRTETGIASVSLNVIDWSTGETLTYNN